MTEEDIMLLRLRNQHLLEPAGCRDVVRDLCGVQAQFMSNAFHALKIRSNDFDPERPGGLVKSWTVRGTMHLFDEADLPLFLHEGRRHFLRPCDTLEADEVMTAERKRYFAAAIAEGVRDGISGREELRELCRHLGASEDEEKSLFNSWGGIIRALCENGTLCHQAGEKKAYRLCPPFEPMGEEEARLEMARRYFTYFGPATVRDAAYFFGRPQRDIKRLLSKLPVTETGCGEKTYFYIDGNGDGPGNMPACIFLAGFDQLMLGYEKTENPFLPPEHLRGIFSLAGIVMPAVLLRGRVAGKWKRQGRAVNITAFESLSKADRDAVEKAAFSLWPDLLEIVYL